jgi:vancomycin resistance protein YoaR
LEDAMTRRLLLVVLGGTMLAIQLVSPAAAQNRQAQPPASSTQSQSMQDMMKMHEQMMAEMSAADAKLDALLKEMNAASGNAKVNAMAAVVTELVRQNRSMHEHMGQMHQQMMGGRGMMMNK